MSSVFVASQSSCFFSLFARTNSPSGKQALDASLNPAGDNEFFVVLCSVRISMTLVFLKGIGNKNFYNDL